MLASEMTIDLNMLCTLMKDSSEQSKWRSYYHNKETWKTPKKHPYGPYLAEAVMLQ